jgi:radical SAM protein with 4Fe4S-binding SPASM domain
MDKKRVENPELLFLELTNRCNADCVMCSHGFMEREEYDMPLWMAYILIKDIMPRRLILHLFGESLLYPDLKEVIILASKYKIRTVLDTNGLLLTPRKFYEISNAGLNELVISFGAVTKEVYNKIWLNLSYDIVTQNIRQAYKTKKKYHLKTVIQIRPIITKENEHQLKDIENIWSKYCDYFTPTKEFHLYKHNRLEPIKINKASCRVRKRLTREAVIKSNGDVILCCNDLDGEYVLGNVLEEDFYSIWNGEKYNDYRYRIYNKVDPPKICMECVIRNW